MRRPAMPPELRERYGPVVPTWELRLDPRPLPTPDGRPDTPEVIEKRRRALARALKDTDGKANKA